MQPELREPLVYSNWVWVLGAIVIVVAVAWLVPTGPAWAERKVAFVVGNLITPRMQATAQNWVVLTELSDTNAFAVGITLALQFAPQLLLVPVTGLIADRFDRRKILLATQSALMVLGFVFLFRSTLRAWLWLGLANVLAWGVLWALKAWLA